MNSTCNLIKTLRVNNHLSPSDFAKIMKVGKSSISKWENDEIPGLVHLYQIARYFRVTIDELLEGKLNNQNYVDNVELNYGLSHYDVPKMIEDNNIKGLIEYYSRCQKIIKTYLKLLQRGASYGLQDDEMRLFKFLKQYIYINAEYLKCESSIALSLLDDTEEKKFKIAKDFFECLKTKSKEEKTWELERAFYFNPKLYVNEILNLGSIEVFEHMFVLLKQVEKDQMLNHKINRCEMLKSIGNKYVLSMLKNGAKVWYYGIYSSFSWDEQIVKDVEGEIKTICSSKKPIYYELPVFNNLPNCTFEEYQTLVDIEKTESLYRACSLRIQAPYEYYKLLKNGEFDSLIDNL